MTHYVPTESPLNHLALVVHCETVAAEDITQLMHDVQLVLPVVPDEHCCEVWSVGNVIGWKWRKCVMRSHIHFSNTMHM